MNHCTCIRVRGAGQEEDMDEVGDTARGEGVGGSLRAEWDRTEGS